MIALTDESSCQPSQSITNEIGRQCNQELISKASSVLLVEVLRQDLGPYNVLRIRQTLRSVCHDRDEHVLLL